MAATVTLAALSSLLFWHNSRLRLQLDDLTQQVDLQSTQLTAQQQELKRITSPATRVIALTGEAAPQASAKLIWDTAHQEWVIYCDNLPRVPDDKDYQLWYITQDASKINALVFRPDAQGHIELRLAVPQGLAPAPGGHGRDARTERRISATHRSNLAQRASSESEAEAAE